MIRSRTRAPLEFKDPARTCLTQTGAGCSLISSATFLLACNSKAIETKVKARLSKRSKQRKQSKQSKQRKPSRTRKRSCKSFGKSFAEKLH